jgi:hypothetical protein
MPKKNYVSGFGEKDPDAAAFLKPENTNPFKMGDASGLGYNSKFDDDTGFERGALGFTDDDKAFRRPSQSKTYGHEGAHDRLANIIDSDESMGSGNKMTGGGGPLSQKRGVGSGPPRYRPKTGPQTNDGV